MLTCIRCSTTKDSVSFRQDALLIDAICFVSCIQHRAKCLIKIKHMGVSSIKPESHEIARFMDRKSDVMYA